MADEARQEERTEAATPRRLQRAREEGHVPISRELPVLASLIAVTLALTLVGPAVLHDLTLRVAMLLSHADAFDGDEGAALQAAALAWVRGAAPFVLAALVAGVGAVLVQTGFVPNFHALKPELSRISPRSGLRRLFSADSLIEAGKSLAKVTVLALATWQVLHAEVGRLLATPLVDPRLLLGRVTAPVFHVLLVVLAAQSAIAIGDTVWVFLRHRSGLRMSRHDIREEQKETEGDPRLKARLRALRMSRARRRMLAAVPKATVVITNPTHYAVALAYDRAKHAAPRVVAKGVDTLALRIREVAEASHVPVVSNPPLARALYRIELDTDIPPEQYQAVAEIIAYVWRLARPRAMAAA
jgi:flagellar biosynthesis protein FlhB